MENYKAEGTRTGEVGELTVPIKMLALSKFREAALMAEQYLRTHPEDGEAYLVFYAASVRSKKLYTFSSGDGIEADVKESLPLYVEHREMLAEFFRFGDEKAIRNVLAYMSAYLTRVTEQTAQGEPLCAPDALGDFFDIVLNALFSYDKKAFVELSFALGKYLLANRAFDAAKNCFENARAQGADEAECLLYILYAAMNIQDESEFIRCERFSVEMPEYINLLLALGDKPDLLDKITHLAEENEKARAHVVEQRERQQREKIYREYQQKGNPAMRVLRTVLFWICAGLSLFYVLFFFAHGAVWDLFIELSPFGREDVSGQIRVSLVTSTVVLIIENVFLLLMVLGMISESPFAVTVRKYVFLFSLHTVGAFGIWYLMYGYAHWFDGWLGFFTVVASIVLALVLDAILLFGFVGVQDSLDSFYNTRMESLRGRIWTRAYNRSLLAILFVSLGVFMMHQRIDVITLLDGGAVAFLFLGGVYLFIVSIIGKIRALFSLRAQKEMTDPTEEREMVVTEYVTGIVLFLLAVVSVAGFAAAGFAWSVHIGFDGALLVSGIVSFLLGAIARGRLKDPKLTNE